MIKLIIEIDDSKFEQPVELWELRADIRNGICKFTGIDFADLSIEVSND